jgi:ectoine hydroxylase-related dioxygenase (phytanoyl-CoA dioxygenase family)
MESNNHPTADERFFFDANGYLILENFLSDEMIENLSNALRSGISRRLQMKELGQLGRKGPWLTVNGANSRIFGILDEDPLFLDLMDYPPVMSYVRALLTPTPHYHASDAIWEKEDPGNAPGWHRDGVDDGYSFTKPNVPHLQLKVGYFLSDMSDSNQGNLTIVPGSHRLSVDPTPEQLTDFESLPGAMQLCVPAGACVMFHNAIWHTPGRWTSSTGERKILYYAYEHNWMMAARQPRYSRSFYHELSSDRKKMFHDVVFEVK